MAGDIVYWLSWLFALSLAAGLVYVAWKGLFGDPDRGARRCPSCWHNMTGTTTLRCAECGRTASSEKVLFRTRRRWFQAIGAMFGCVLLFAIVQERILSHGWVSVVPSRVLVFALPLVTDTDSAWFQEIDRRLDRSLLTEGETTALIQRIVNGDPGAPPPTVPWRRKYGDMASQWRNTVSLTEEQIDLLLQLPPQVVAVSPTDWPLGVIPRVRLELIDWWPVPMQVGIKAEPQLDGAATTEARRGVQQSGPPLTIPLATLPPGDHAVDLKLNISRRLGGGAGWRDIVAVTEQVDVTVLDSDRPPLEAQNTDSQLERMQRVFRNGWVRWNRGDSPVRINVAHNQTHVEAFRDVAVGVRIELRCDGELARRLELWWLGGPQLDERNRSWETVFEDRALLAKSAAPTAARHEWTMTVTGDPALALRVGAGTSYWLASTRSRSKPSRMVVARPLRKCRGC